jgi:hypothetical protein
MPAAETRGSPQSRTATVSRSKASLAERAQFSGPIPPRAGSAIPWRPSPVARQPRSRAYVDATPEPQWQHAVDSFNEGQRISFWSSPLARITTRILRRRGKRRHRRTPAPVRPACKRNKVHGETSWKRRENSRRHNERDILSREFASREAPIMAAPYRLDSSARAAHRRGRSACSAPERAVVSTATPCEFS